jgi:hypothetical protein
VNLTESLERAIQEAIAKVCRLYPAVDTARQGRTEMQGLPKYGEQVMANRECNGDFFRAEGQWYYWCLWDGLLVCYQPLGNGDECPFCKRIIDARNHGEVVTTRRIVVEAVLPNGTLVEICADERAKSTGN